MTAKPEVVRARLDREVDRERGIISQSNARSGAMAQLVAAVLGAAGIAVALILSRDGVHLTQASVAMGVCAVIFMMAMLVGLVVVMWPRWLSRLPNDRNEQAYKARLTREAEQMSPEGAAASLDSEFTEGFLLQRIGRIKETATQVTLVMLALFVPVAVLFLCSSSTECCAAPNPGAALRYKLFAF